MERIQPHDDYVGIFKILDYFRHNPSIKLFIQYPYHFVGVGLNDYERTKNDTRFRQSIMFQYPLETTDKKCLVVMHNDMLFYGDMIGDMLKTFENSPKNVVGVGSIGQCWSCPAGPNWGDKCNPHKFEQYIPTTEEAIELAQKHATPRRDLQIEVIKNGRTHLLPECQLNEYCAMIDVELYRKETLPQGDIGCYGGSWNGVDLGTVWSHDMYKRGYRFRHLTLENYTRHAAFDSSGSGTKPYSSAETYWNSEQNAQKYIHENFGPIHFSFYMSLSYAYDNLVLL